MTDYAYDVFVSYARKGWVEPWVHAVFVPNFKLALQEELGRANLFVDKEMPTGTEWPDYLRYALLRSRVMVAVFSGQYFSKAWCQAEINTMILRRDRFHLGEGNPPRHPVHAIVVHDCVNGPPEPYATIQNANFTDHTNNLKKASNKCIVAIRELASDVAETVRLSPTWAEDFPLAEVPTEEARPPMARPRF